MNPRSIEILSAVIRDFIETGDAVSSGELYRRYGFGVKPATIRNELSFLTDEGFLAQPHTSGGRVPTDKGYRFFVERIITEIEPRQSTSISEFSRELTSGDFGDFVDDAARQLRALGVGYEREGMFRQSGLDALFAALENDLTDLHDAYRIVEDFEKMEERMHELSSFVNGKTPTVFIGKSPITRSPHLSVIADRFDAGDEEVIFAVVGPKRMDYHGNLRFFIDLKRKLEHHG